MTGRERDKGEAAGNGVGSEREDGAGVADGSGADARRGRAVPRSIHGLRSRRTGRRGGALLSRTRPGFTARVGSDATISIRFTDVTAAARIEFVHATGAFGEKWMPETMGSGVVVLDYDGDRWPDLFFILWMTSRRYALMATQGMRYS